MFSEQVIRMKKELKNTFLYGAIFSCIGSCIWLLSVKWGKEAVVFLLVMAVIAFLIYFISAALTHNAPKAVKIVIKTLIITITIISLVYVLFTVLAAYAIFYPRKSETADKILAAGEFSGSVTKKIEFDSENGKISGWMIKNKEDNAPMVLYFGGNMEVSGDTVIGLITKGYDKSIYGECNFVMLDMPGYGNTDGFPTEKSLKAFGLAAYDYVTEKYQPDKIIVIGYSIGTGTAHYVTSERKTDGAVFLAPYADGIDLNNSRLNIFYGPMRELVAYRMEAIKFAGKIKVKPLVYASTTDEIIPYSSSEKFKNAYPDGCYFHTLENVSHANFFNVDEVREGIAKYISEVTKN